MSEKTSRASSELLAAATAFDAELARYGRAVEAAERRALDSRRSLEVVAESLKEAANAQDALDACAQALREALNNARARQEAQAAAAHAVALELEKRSQEYENLLVRVRGLGADAGQITELAKGLVAGGEQGATVSLLRERLEALDARLAEATGSADRLVSDARGGQFEEIAREAHSFRQNFQAIHRKLTGLRQQLIVGDQSAEESRGAGGHGAAN